MDGHLEFNRVFLRAHHTLRMKLFTQKCLPSSIPEDHLTGALGRNG